MIGTNGNNGKDGERPWASLWLEAEGMYIVQRGFK